MNIKKTNLELVKGVIYFDNDLIKLLEDEIVNFINDQDYLTTLEFIKKVMLRR